MACRTGCPTQDHKSWGECARASHINTAVGDASMQYQAWDKDTERFEQAARDGLDPTDWGKEYTENLYREAEKK